MSAQTQSTPSTNYYLSGNFAPVKDESVFDDLTVTGEIPADLVGTFLRIGPNPLYIDDKDTYHPFDGDGMIHAVRFEEGKAGYRNRYVETRYLQAERDADRPLWRGLQKRMLGSAMVGAPEDMPHKNRSNTAMVYHNNTLYSMSESSPPHTIHLPDLSTSGEHSFNGKLNHPFTAHPKVDVETGEMMFFGYLPFPPYVMYSVADANGEIVHTTPIELTRGVMMHDFAITRRYSVFLDCPIAFGTAETIARGEPMLGWNADHGTRVGVVPRYGKSEDTRWFTVDTCMIGHVANAWEEEDVVVLQGCRSNKTDIVDLQSMEDADEGITDDLGQLYEWRLDMNSGEVQEKCLHKVHSDFCRINDAFTGVANRYVYAVQYCVGNPFTFDAILKHDNQTGQTLTHQCGTRLYTSEAVFAPAVGSTTEDEGYVVSLVYDESTNSSACMVLDAQNFDGPPLAIVHIPRRVPHGFHAAWVPESN